jgi:LAO/AO transport system kinase
MTQSTPIAAMPSSSDSLLSDFRNASRLALSRALTLAENRDAGTATLLSALDDSIGRAFRIGVTGPPGAGKSTLITKLIQHWLESNLKVGVLAVDPTSPFSGGALLGDRVRMTSIGMDSRVFVRSLATRGSSGGLARAVGEMADLMDAFGLDPVLLETVGVGQSEFEIVQYVDTTVVVLVPESGDAIQAMKAGLMEIGDIFVINKSDREGATRFANELNTALDLREWHGWRPPILSTVASAGKGIPELAQELRRHEDYLRKENLWEQRRLQRGKRKYQQVVEDEILGAFWTAKRKRLLDDAVAQGKSAYALARKLLLDVIREIRQSRPEQ